MNPNAAALLMGDRPARVMVVDDQPSNIEMVGTILGKLGCDIVVATDGPTALKRLALNPVDVLLLDLNMPGMGGIEVCRALAGAGQPDLPVIFLSGFSEKDLVVRALDAGGVDYITKPFHHAELVSRVRTQLELKHARDRLRQLAADKDELIGLLAHDLKNQLGGLEMSALLLWERLQKWEPADPRATLLAENLAHNGGQLLSFVKNFLANAAADHGVTLQAQPLGLNQEVQAAVKAWQEAARRKEIRLAAVGAETELVVQADAAALAQVLSNLISNAVKFSPTGKSVAVSARPVGTWAEIAVQDEGPGFTAEDHARMFQRYTRLSARPTAGEPSSGLGLSIVRKLVGLMQGELTCENAPGQGAVFRVRLPLANLEKG